MKRIIVAIIAVVMFMPLVHAEEKFNSMNLGDTLAAEEIEVDLSNYEESDDQVTIYLFRGQGCSHCRDFLTFLSESVEEYGKYFKLESYETWNDKNNSNLMKKVARRLGTKADGVPFIVIGKKYFSGFGDDSKTKMINAIKKEYDAKTKFDVLEELDKKGGISDGVVIGIIFSVVILGLAGLIIYSRKSN